MTDTSTTSTVSALPSYVLSILSTVGALIGGYLISKGYLTASAATEIGGGILAVIVAGVGLYEKTHAVNALNAAIAAPAGVAK